MTQVLKVKRSSPIGKYFCTDVFDKYPNKYNLKYADIGNLKILDWSRLMEKTWCNEAMTDGIWYCHIEGCQPPDSYKFNDESEFWIGFREEDNKVRFHFTADGGMCWYNFDEFYNYNDGSIQNGYDAGVQVNAMRWLTMMIDEGILGLGDG